MRPAHGGTFVKDHEGKFYLVFGDVPFGYFRGLRHNVRFSRSQVVTILLGAKQVLHKEGTIIIRIGEYDKDMWVEVAKECGLYCERNAYVLVHNEAWAKKKAYCSRTKPSQCHYMLIMHHVSDHMGTGNSWFVNKTKFGHLKGHSNTDDPHVDGGVQSVPNAHKLQDKDGKVVQPQENHALELAEFIFRFCPPTGTMLDICAGTLASMLACFLLNRQEIFND